MYLPQYQLTGTAAAAVRLAFYHGQRIKAVALVPSTTAG